MEVTKRIMYCNECGEEFEAGQRAVGITGGYFKDFDYGDDGPIFMPDDDEGYIALYHSGERDCWDVVSRRIWPSPAPARS